jgi:16S rRNA (guanine527-N7)-methyltransferase
MWLVALAAISALHTPSAPSAELLATCTSAAARLGLPAEVGERVQAYVRLLFAYNERTNVYSKSAYGRLPFHVEDSLTLATVAGAGASRGLLDLGSGSGLPSLVLACVRPELPVFAVESKSRKTRFLAHAATELGLEAYTPLTQNVNELARSWVFDVDAVTAKAFKPLDEVGPIARKCVAGGARLVVPISEAQVREFGLAEPQLERRGEFVYFAQPIEPSRDVEQRKLVSLQSHPR